MRLRSPLWGWGWGWSTHVLLSGSFVWPSLPAYFFTYIAFLPVHNLLTSMSKSSLEFPGLCLASVHSSHVHYMNVALQLVNWWLILACLSGTKWPSRSHVFFFFTMLSEKALRLLPNVSEITEKQKKSLNLLLKRKDVLGWLPTGFGRSLIY